MDGGIPQSGPLMYLFWYWQVDEDADHVFSAKVLDKIVSTDEEYLDWKRSHDPGHVAAYADLYQDIQPKLAELAERLPEWAKPANLPAGDPVVKLRSFLRANPDVHRILMEDTDQAERA